MITSLWMFPVAAAVLLPGTFFLTYSIAVYNDHVQAIIPYISDTGSYPPESCIFGQLLNMSAVLIGLVMYFRHRQVVEFYRHAATSGAKHIKFSNTFLWVGYTSAFGISLVGNCPQTSWLLAHMIGAMLAFGCGLIYCWGQTIFSYKMEDVLQKRWTCHLRLVIALFATLCFSLTGIFGFNPFTDITPQRTAYLNDCALWQLVFIKYGDQGYVEHNITTGCEWGMALLFVAYFATYAVELRHAYLIPPILKLRVGHALLPKDPGHKCDSAMLSLYMGKGDGSGKSPHAHGGENLKSPDQGKLKIEAKDAKEAKIGKEPIVLGKESGKGTAKVKEPGKKR